MLCTVIYVMKYEMKYKMDWDCDNIAHVFWPTTEHSKTNFAEIVQESLNLDTSNSEKKWTSVEGFILEIRFQDTKDGNVISTAIWYLFHEVE